MLYKILALAAAVSGQMEKVRDGYCEYRGTDEDSNDKVAVHVGDWVTAKGCAAIISKDHLCEYFYVGMPGLDNSNCVCCVKGTWGIGPREAGYTVYRVTNYWDQEEDFEDFMAMMLV